MILHVLIGFQPRDPLIRAGHIEPTTKALTDRVILPGETLIDDTMIKLIDCAWSYGLEVELEDVHRSTI